MTPQKSPAPPKPTLPPFWRWLTRITAAIALTLFLVPTVYVVKYYAIDRPREDRIFARVHAKNAISTLPNGPDMLLSWQYDAHSNGNSASRVAAVQEIGTLLRKPGVNWQRPLECLGAKATLADLATHDADPAVRTAASEELGKVAQSGAVIRR